MKPRHLITIAVGIAIVALTSCATTTTTVTEYPDGRKVTTTTKAIDPESVTLGQAAAAVATQIIAEK